VTFIKSTNEFFVPAYVEVKIRYFSKFLYSERK